MKSWQIIVLGMCALVSSFGYAAQHEYRFDAMIAGLPSVSTLSAPRFSTLSIGDSISGRWIVETDRDGEALPTVPGEQSFWYHLKSLTIDIGGETLEQLDRRVYISESRVGSASLNIWPSGFASSYSVPSAPGRDIPFLGAEVRRFWLEFSYDGLGIWDNFTVPSDFDFLSNTIFGTGVYIDVQEEGASIFGELKPIFATFNSVSVSVIPLPSPLLLLGLSGLGLIRFRRSKRR